ncbi:MAG: hypothetical protein Ct9H90mP5_10070 [Acidimicrobiaceae bacterium]|nr:MAG: hypothetical protein Ct9H90mP5_10070 [Acidimicrobiaceae bacterium]
MPSTPLTFNEVTPQWLSEVLNANVTSFESEKIGEGVGLMGDIKPGRTQLRINRIRDAPICGC